MEKMELQSKEKNEAPTVTNTKTNNNTATFSSSAASNVNTTTRNNKTMAQYSADAKLMAEYEQSGMSGKLFDYSKSVTGTSQISCNEEQMTAYLTKIQRGGLVQPFGCMLAIEQPTFRILAYSENCFDILGLKSLVDSKQLESLIGVDVRTLFTPSSRTSIVKAVASREISLLNPIWVQSRSNSKSFYAILHRIDVGIVIDLEPAHSGDPGLLLAGAVQSQKLAVRAISRLQALPGGDIGALCDTVVTDVQKLTGYDRVMVYKFHEDNHGEVVSEIRRSDLEPHLGLHYPSTDIPQAARFLFKQNRVRMIWDCNAQPVKIVQSGELKQPLVLVNSTLRSPHGCHTQYMANMGSLASLVMAVVINNGNSTKLWGLVVCHHTAPRYVSFPLRYACEFLMQAFGLQLYLELQLAAQLAEKKVLRMQTLLCDMLLRDAPLGIVNQSPSIKDLIKCDGAALYYKGKCWLLGVTPSESQLKDIAQWLINSHGDSTGLSTDSLAEAGYPGAIFLGDAVCGMAMARITSTDFLFWFRSHTAKEVKWGGAKHQPEEKDDCGKMNPRSSFIAFLEVVKSKSMPWEVPEINAIHSLQLIMRDSFREVEEIGDKTMMDYQQNDTDELRMEELRSVAWELVRLIETATAPIFAVNSSGLINGWNSKMVELTGLQASEATGKSLANEVVHTDSREVVESLVHKALHGEEERNIEVKLQTFGADQSSSVIYLLANACASRDHKNDVVGVCFVGQDVTSEKVVMDKFIRLEGDYKTIIESLNPLIPPIFASDENACCSEWNVAMEKLTGWPKHEIIGKILPGEIFGGLCQVKDHDTLTKFMIVLYRAISGQTPEKLPFGFFDRNGKYVEAFLTANKRADESGYIVGCFCFLQTVVNDSQFSSVGKEEDEESLLKLKELNYIRQEMKNPLNGIRFTHKLLESSGISEDQKQFLDISDACERQIMTIIQEIDFRGVEQGQVELNMEEFLLGNVIDAIVSQVMDLLKEKKLQLVHDIPDKIKTVPLYGDRIKLQLVLSDFLLSIVNRAPLDSWVEIKVSPGLRLIQDGNEFVHLQFRMAHPGEGLPAAHIEDVSGASNKKSTEEGIALNLSRKLVNIMNGRVNYTREENKCYFLIDLDVRTVKTNV